MKLFNKEIEITKVGKEYTISGIPLKDYISRSSIATICCLNSMTFALSFTRKRDVITYCNILNKFFYVNAARVCLKPVTILGKKYKICPINGYFIIDFFNELEDDVVRGTIANLANNKFRSWLSYKGFHFRNLYDLHKFASFINKYYIRTNNTISRNQKTSIFIFHDLYYIDRKKKYYQLNGDDNQVALLFTSAFANYADLLEDIKQKNHITENYCFRTKADLISFINDLKTMFILVNNEITLNSIF